MKREFGKKLIENFFQGEVTLTRIIDTSGAFIPSHGTPTVILVGRNNSNTKIEESTIRTILGIRGEPEQPDNPVDGIVWRAIVDQVDQPGSESEWVGAADIKWSAFEKHPWSLSGGGAGNLQLILESSRVKLFPFHIKSIGRTTVVGEDHAWVRPDQVTLDRRNERLYSKPFVVGDSVRDFCISGFPYALNPYADSWQTVTLPSGHRIEKFSLWPVRQILRGRIIFGKTLQDQGRPWFEHLENYANKLRVPLSIVFAEVATHNHFVLDRGGKIFKQTAPVIKLPDTATEDDHLKLLGVLNSSTVSLSG